MPRLEFTPRELDVLRAYPECGSQKAVGARLGISEQTVKNHLSSVYTRLGVDGVLEAYVVLGWLKVPQR